MEAAFYFCPVTLDIFNRMLERPSNTHARVLTHPFQIQLGNGHNLLKFKFLSEYRGVFVRVEVFPQIFFSQKLVCIFLSPKDDML